MENKDRPAFPVTKDMGYSDTGLSKREYFAGLAMQGVLSHRHPQTPTPNQAEDIARYSIAIADELLKQIKEQ